MTPEDIGKMIDLAVKYGEPYVTSLVNDFSGFLIQITALRVRNEKLTAEIKALKLSLTGISTDLKTEPFGCPCPGACSALKIVERNEKLERAK